jgi:hypothetical protein
MRNNRFPGLWSSLAVFVIFVSVLTGCVRAPVPATYQMSPQEVHDFRSGLGTIGVVVSQHRSELEFNTPAKGKIGGFGRGFAAGAATPIVIGLVAPVPGGTLIGALISPFTGIYGGFSGMSKAPPIEEVKIAEAGINKALDRVRALNLGQSSLPDFVRLAEARSSFDFVPLPDIGPKQPDEIVRYDEMDLPEIDTILEARLEKGGLWGAYEIDPPSAAFMKLRLRVIRKKDNAVLVEDTVFCVGEERKYIEWGKNYGQRFYDNALACVPRFQEKIVDDLFLVYPTSTQ